MGLEIAQYVESQKDEIGLMYWRSDMSRAFTQMTGTDLLLAEIGVFVSDSAEAQRQLETLKQLFMNSNSTGATPVDLATVITSNSPSEIKAQIKASYDALQAQQQGQFDQQQQMEQQKIEAQQQMANEARAFEAEQNDLDRANQRYIAEVKSVAMGTLRGPSDADNNGIPDVLEVQKYNLEIGKHSEDVLFKRQQEMNRQAESDKKMKLEKERTNLMKSQQEQEDRQMDKQLEDNEKDRQLKREELKSKEKIAKMKPKPKSK